MIRPEDPAARRFDRAHAFFEAIPRVFACQFHAPRWGPEDLYNWSPPATYAR